jgi:hypothetical protein
VSELETVLHTRTPAEAAGEVYAMYGNPFIAAHIAAQHFADALCREKDLTFEGVGFPAREFVVWVLQHGPLSLGAINPLLNGKKDEEMRAGEEALRLRTSSIQLLGLVEVMRSEQR